MSILNTILNLIHGSESLISIPKSTKILQKSAKNCKKIKKKSSSYTEIDKNNDKRLHQQVWNPKYETVCLHCKMFRRKPQ